MVMPSQYQRASHDFEQFMLAARDEAGLETTNMAWGMVQGVLWAFRRRLTVAQTAAFSDVLPPVLRAVFLEGWDPDAAPVPFASRQAMTEEVRALRRQHNFAPPHSIHAVAVALKRSVDQERLDKALSMCAPEARAFWSTEAP